MASTGFAYDDRFLLHDTGPGHPERSDRLRAIVAALRSGNVWDQLTHLQFSAAERRWIETNHSPVYIDRVQRTCAAGAPYIDTPDSAICPQSFDVACLAVGAVLAACDAVMEQRVRNAFCAVRPPGHHAEYDRSMGFCLFNNIAIAARSLRERWNISRVLILDWDVHHGNGTQHAFEDDPGVFFCSFHEDPSQRYPGTGHAHESGRGGGTGFTLNIPMPIGSGDAEYEAAYTQKFLPAARLFAPEFVLVSAGFDAHAADPLATAHMSDAGFAWLSREVVKLANEHCGGRLVSVLEGGYDLDALSHCAIEHVHALLDAKGIR